MKPLLLVAMAQIQTEDETEAFCKNWEKRLGVFAMGNLYLLHFNELPFRALFIFIDGPSSGPNSCTGPLRLKLLNCETLTIVKYKSIEYDIPDMNPKDFSKDQKYLYETAKAIRSGECSVEIASQKPGPINQARWLITANRI